jgi:hypothetical protein
MVEQVADQVAEELEHVIKPRRSSRRLLVRVAEDEVRSMFFGSGTLVRLDSRGETLTSLPTEWKVTRAGYLTTSGPTHGVITIEFESHGTSDGRALEYRFAPD